MSEALLDKVTTLLEDLGVHKVESRYESAVSSNYLTCDGEAHAGQRLYGMPGIEGINIFNPSLLIDVEISCNVVDAATLSLELEHNGTTTVLQQTMMQACSFGTTKYNMSCMYRLPAGSKIHVRVRSGVVGDIRARVMLESKRRVYRSLQGQVNAKPVRII